MTTDTVTTHFDYHSIDHNLLKLDILGHDDPTMIRMLQDLTGIDPTKIPLDDPQVMSLFQSENIEPVFFEKARELGVWMGQNKKTLVYGGANIGLMECIAKAAKDNGSMIMGVIPTKLEERG